MPIEISTKVQATERQSMDTADGNGTKKIPSGPRRHHTLLRGYYIEAMETTRNGRNLLM
jgi:hypothetical protein